MGQIIPSHRSKEILMASVLFQVAMSFSKLATTIFPIETQLQREGELEIPYCFFQEYDSSLQMQIFPQKQSPS